MKKAASFKVGLWSVWLSGFLLICLSLYFTARLPSLKDSIGRPIIDKKRRLAGPSVTIFSAPRSFGGETGSRQALAIKSWLALSPDVLIVLFARDPSVIFSAGQFGKRVSVESDVDFTFLGTPFFHSVVARSRSSKSSISVLIDPETILFPNFVSTLNYAHKLDQDWLLMAQASNFSHFPFHLDDNGRHWRHEDGTKLTLNKLQEFLVEERQWSTCKACVILAWNTGELPLHTGVLPPFLYGRGFHDHWIINEALSSELRFVFDASDVISSYYPGRLTDGASQISTVQGAKGERTWEYEANAKLAGLYGSYYLRGTNFVENLVRLIECNGKYLFAHLGKGIAYNIQDPGKERAGLRRETLLQSRRDKNQVSCIQNSKLVVEWNNCSLKGPSKNKAPLYLPYSLESLLQIMSDKNKSIILVVAGNNYRDMLMSWGLPVFKDELAPSNISFNDCHFGTECFTKVTKVKSRTVLKILKLGYNVLLSDVDVYWFKNPLRYVYSFGPSVLVAQSDEYNETAPINLPRRLNSGFYFAHSDGPTISAMEKVVKHAATSGLSEQPSFYDVLCGEGGIHRISNDKCLEPETNLTVHFLDRKLFPNGAYRGFWEKKNIRGTCRKSGCIILHNNWISGRKRKLKRQVSSGLWEFDPTTLLCLKR